MSTSAASPAATRSAAAAPPAVGDPPPRVDCPPVPLKNRWLAGVLAFLVPGLGHLYQGRLFKSAIYFVCIMGVALAGLSLSEWKAVAATRIETVAGRPVPQKVVGYYAQFPVGVVSLPALVQSRRYQHPDNHTTSRLADALETEFLGVYQSNRGEQMNRPVEVRGDIALRPEGDRTTGTFVGTTADGEPIEIPLGDLEIFAPPIEASEGRYLRVATLGDTPEGVLQTGFLEGVVPRPLWNWYAVPQTEAIAKDLFNRFNSWLDLAKVFTYIAGFLNILAIYDAIDGPAYGIVGEKAPAPPEKPDKRRWWQRLFGRQAATAVETPTDASQVTE